MLSPCEERPNKPDARDVPELILIEGEHMKHAVNIELLSRIDSRVKRLSSHDGAVIGQQHRMVVLGLLANGFGQLQISRTIVGHQGQMTHAHDVIRRDGGKHVSRIDIGKT